MIQLREYQLRAVDRVREAIAQLVSFVLFVLPTGGGKTVVAAYIIRCAIERGSRVLFVAHRRELIRQTFCKLLRSGIPVHEIGIVMAGVSTARPHEAGPCDLSLKDDELWKYARRRPAARVQVASIDTLRRAPKPEADLVIVDEAHRALAASYKLLREWYAKAVHLGLTATPVRGDGAPLGSEYQALIEVASIRELIDWGFLVEPKAWTVPAGSLPDLRKVKVTAGDYKLDDLDKACNQGALVGDIVDHWQRRGGGQRTVCFAVSIEHSKTIVERFRAAGIAAEHLDGETPTEDRDAILARLERGETRVVSNCNVLCEGWDMPSVKTLILARPTKSLGLCLQMAGRILRPWEGVGAVILDHAGCMIEHGLPQDAGDWSLEKKQAKRRGAREDGAKVCPNPDCLTVIDLGMRVCPECGAELPFRERKPPEESAGELVEATGATRLRQLQAWVDLCDEWRADNAKRMLDPKGRPKKPGSLFFTWRKRNQGRNPPKGCKLPKMSQAEIDRIYELDIIKAPSNVVTISTRLNEELRESDARAWDDIVSKTTGSDAPARRVSW